MHATSPNDHNSHMPKHHASVAELKARLSEYLRTVKAGGEVVVTDRGRPVARLLPVALDATTPAAVRRLVEQGLAREPRRRLPASFWSHRRANDPAGRGVEALLEERAEER